MALRASDDFQKDNLSFQPQRAFPTVGMAKVATSAEEALNWASSEELMKCVLILKEELPGRNVQ